MDRRTLLAHLRSGLLLSAASSLVPDPLWSATRGRRQPVALLVPLSGPSAALGLSMSRAAMLAESAQPALPIDTAANGAARAAAMAMKQGAKLILGPLFAAEVRPVVSAVGGRVPVLSFSNDDALRESGAFTLGLTATQLVSAMLLYARKRGIRRVAVEPGNDAWSVQASAAAHATAATAGVEIVLPDGTGSGQQADALLVPQGGAGLVAAAQRMRGSGVQLLALQQTDLAMSADLEGAWFVAPDPKPIGDFARTYSARHGGTPGVIAALAYDGVRIVDRLRAGGRLDQSALLAAGRLPAVTGALRFRSDGSCARDLVILVAWRDGYTTVDTITAA